MSQELYLGIDVGSTTVKIVALDRGGGLLAWRYARSLGQPRPAVRAEAASLAAELGMSLDELASRAAAVGFTGSGGRPAAELLGGRHVNELVAQVRAIGEYCPQARTIVEIGGQDSKFMSVQWDETLGKMILTDMALNNLCAAGTGAFLDQQAERLGIAIDGEFAEIAMCSENPARIAGRCTVFAKSDMIHLQQTGTPLEDILAGLSMALARNFKSVIGKGKAFTPPVVFQGGVAYNRAVARAFTEVLRLQPGELIIPEHHHLMPALGCAYVALDDPSRCAPFAGFAALDPAARAHTTAQAAMPRLPREGVAFAERDPPVRNPQRQTRRIPVYVGVDVGSITTKVVVIDEAGAVLARRYLQTRGRPLEVVRQALFEVGAEVAERVTVMGVGATGSGRHLTADFVGGDVVRSEITAQARAALAIDPQVDTIFEIGGQDSKFIRLQDGAVVNFAMNSACAAGTGSFLEEQADRLQISIEDDFSWRAFCSDCPAALGERCTVFMESDLVHHQQQGAQVTDLTAGLAYAIVENYMNRVVGNREVGQRIFFQGGVAWNDAVVAAFQTLVGRPVIVPLHHDVTGAIGAALLARDEMEQQRRAGNNAQTRFRGFDLRSRYYTTKSFICRACPNLCEINRVEIGDEPPIFYGARCELYETGRSEPAPQTGQAPDLFAERMALLMGDYRPPGQRRPGRMRVGLPRTLHFYDLFPYWRTLFDELGMDLVLSSETNPTIARYTKESAAAETCYPAKLAYGHAMELLEKDIDLLFMPAVINREDAAPGQDENTYCVFIRAAGYMTAAGIDTRGVPVLTTPLHLQWEGMKRQDLRTLAQELGVSYRRMVQADAAGHETQRAFYASLRARGCEALAQLDGERPAIVTVGRPYNTADPGVSQNLPYELRKLGALPIPLDFLPVSSVDVSGEYAGMFWRCGQDILAAAALIRQDPRLHAVYVTSFNCGPDSFILSYFRRMMAGKPFLELEVDDHTSEAGIVTRCEAFLESLQTRRWIAAVARTGDNGHGAGEIATRPLAPALPASPLSRKGANGDGEDGAHERTGEAARLVRRRQGST